MKNKIINYLKTENTDFLDFISTLSTKSPDIAQNSKNFKDIEERWYKLKRFENGIYMDIYEADFNAYSFNLIKIYNKDEELQKLIEIVDSFDFEDKHLKFRLKRFRIHLYLSLSYIKSPFFNHQLYNQIQQTMYDTTQRLVDFVKEKGGCVHAIGYDSCTFSGKEIPIEEINEMVSPSTVKIRHYKEIIKMRNVVFYQFADSLKWIEKRSTGTDYDGLKREILEALKKRDYQSAIRTVEESSISSGLKKYYVKDIDDIRKCQQSKN